MFGWFHNIYSMFNTFDYRYWVPIIFFSNRYTQGTSFLYIIFFIIYINFQIKIKFFWIESWPWLSGRNAYLRSQFDSQVTNYVANEIFLISCKNIFISVVMKEYCAFCKNCNSVIFYKNRYYYRYRYINNRKTKLLFLNLNFEHCSKLSEL